MRETQLKKEAEEDSKPEELLALKKGRWPQAKEFEWLLDATNDPEVTASKETDLSRTTARNRVLPTI